MPCHRFRAFSLLLFIAISAHAQSAGAADEKMRKCPRSGKPDYFLPSGYFSQPIPGDDDQEMREDFSNYMRRVKETSLSCGTISADRVFRFTARFALGHNDEIIRIDVHGSSTVITRVIFGYRNGRYKHKVILSKTTRTLSPEEWRPLDTAIQNSTFFSWPPDMNSPPMEDGWGVWIEIRDKDRYHLVTDSPSGYYRKSRKFAELCGLFLRLIGVDFELPPESEVVDQ